MTIRVVVVPSVHVVRGDVIVVECPGAVTPTERDELEARLKKLWPRNRRLILTDGAQLKIGIARPPVLGRATRA